MKSFNQSAFSRFFTRFPKLMLAGLIAVLDVKDRDGLPCTITMKVPADCAKNFEKWLEDNQDDLFAHAEGGNVEY